MVQFHPYYLSLWQERIPDIFVLHTWKFCEFTYVIDLILLNILFFKSYELNWLNFNFLVYLLNYGADVLRWPA